MYVFAIETAKWLILESKDLGLEFDTLDIGGGFPIHYKSNDIELDFYEFCKPIWDSLQDVTIRVIAEPGWVLVAPSITAVCEVVGKWEKDGV